jgi:NAD(P)-dependent dehydrogenase (short-subunit alcohol dehydrogenase family)
VSQFNYSAVKAGIAGFTIIAAEELWRYGERNRARRADPDD